MARSVCSICQHPQASQINAALARPGHSVRLVAETFALDKTTLWRHRKACLAEQLSKAIERQQVISGASMISESLGVKAIVSQSLQDSAQNGQHSLIAGLAGAHVKVSEHIARLAGLDGFKQPTQQVNIDARGGKFLLMPYSGEPVRELGPGPEESSD